METLARVGSLWDRWAEHRRRDCVADKNTTRIRFDLRVCLKPVYDEFPDSALLDLAGTPIWEEPDARYQTKYRTVWKKLLLKG